VLDRHQAGDVAPAELHALAAAEVLALALGQAAAKE
jgi:hypothetical protein